MKKSLTYIRRGTIRIDKIVFLQTMAVARNARTNSVSIAEQLCFLMNPSYLFIQSHFNNNNCDVQNRRIYKLTIKTGEYTN